MTRRNVISAMLFVAACSSSESDVERTNAGNTTPDAAAAAGEIGTEQISAGNFVFDVRVAGPEDGEVVILLHGFPQTSYEWRRQLTALADAGYRAVAPDQRGYSPGARPAAVEDYAVTNLFQDVLGIADAIGAERFHIVGHDWGAAVAWVVGILAADRIITINTVSVPHPDAFSQQLADMSSCQYAASSYFDFFITPEATDFFLVDDNAQLKTAFAGIPAEDIDVYVSAVGTRPAMDAALNWYRANVQNRMIAAPALGPATVPTMFVWSDGDTFLCREGGELTADFVTASYRFEVIPGVNHWVADLAPDELNALLLDHLGEFRESP